MCHLVTIIWFTFLFNHSDHITMNINKKLLTSVLGHFEVYLVFKRDPLQVLIGKAMAFSDDALR